MQCPVCESQDIEVNESSGDAICVECGTVIEENNIVSSIEFQEIGERSTVIGQYVGATSSKPLRASYSNQGSSQASLHIGLSRESREATLSKAKRVITQVAGIHSVTTRC